MRPTPSLRSSVAVLAILGAAMFWIPVLPMFFGQVWLLYHVGSLWWMIAVATSLLLTIPLSVVCLMRRDYSTGAIGLAAVLSVAIMLWHMWCIMGLSN
jgi:hypothetical protein